MARKMQILPAGDTGSSAAAGAARSGLDGTGSETGLNAGHSRHLRDALAACTRAGRRVNGGSCCLPRGGRCGPASELNTTGVRERARAQGTEVKDRGRNPPGRPPSSKRRSASKRAAQPRYQYRPPGTSGHSTPVTAGAVPNELTERRA